MNIIRNIEFFFYNNNKKIKKEKKEMQKYIGKNEIDAYIYIILRPDSLKKV